MITFGAAVARFLKALPADGYSAETVRKTRGTVRQMKQIAEVDEEFPLGEVARWQVEMLTSHPGWSGRGRYEHFLCLRRFFDWAVGEGLITRSPMAGMTAPSLYEGKRQVDPFADDDLPVLLQGCVEIGYRRWMRARNRAIIHVLWWTGAWRRDVVKLKVSDLDLKAPAVSMNGKKYPLSAAAAREISRFMEVRGSDSPVLFLNHSREPLGIRAMETLFVDLAEHVGFAVNSRRFRATYTKRAKFQANPHSLMNLKWPECSLTEARDGFLANNTARQLSASSREKYAETLAEFLAYFMPGRASAHPSDITPHDIDGFLQSLAGRGISEHTLHRHYRSLKRFFNFLLEVTAISASPMARMKGPKLPKITIEPYSPEEVARLLAASDGVYVERDRAAITVLVGAGLRKAELTNLELRHVHPGRLLVKEGKGRKDRWVPLDPYTEGVLRRWAEKARGSKLFDYGRFGLYIMLKRLCREAGVRQYRVVHRFRDTFACRFLENGGGIDDLQVILGHSDIGTTLRYVRWNREQRAVDAGRAFLPWAKQNGKSEVVLLDELERIRRQLETLAKGQA